MAASLQGAALLIVLGVGLVVVASSLTGFPRPSLEGILNGVWASAVEKSITQASPLRRPSVVVWHGVECQLLNHCPVADGQIRRNLDFERVIVGHQGWLFLIDEYYQDADNIEENLVAIARLDRLMRQMDVRLVVALVPIKARIYTQYLPRDFALSSVLTARYGAALARLEQDGVVSPDIAARLSGAEATGTSDLMYFQTDSHWTPTGALEAAQAVRGALADVGALPYSIERAAVTRSDLGISSFSTDLSGFLGTPVTEPYSDFFATRSSTNETDGQIALVGTSYSSPGLRFIDALALETQLSVEHAARPAAGAWIPMLEYVTGEHFLSNKPDIIVWEVPERVLPLASREAEQALDALRLQLERARN